MNEETNYSQYLSVMSSERLEMELAAVQQCLNKIHPMLQSTRSQLEDDLQLIKNLLNNALNRDT